MSATHFAYSALEQIHACKTPTELAEFTKRLIGGLGASAYVYSIHITDDNTPDQFSQRHVMSSDNEWCELYNKKRWFMNDPFIEYAKRNSSPVFGSDIVPKTQGQRDMLQMAGRYGFLSGILVPTHSSNNVEERVSMLYVGCDAAPEVGEPMLKTLRIIYRALGMELLDWWINYLREKAAEKFKLNAEEIQLLQLSKNGCVVSEIGAKLSLKPSNLYRKFDIIKDKFNVEKIGEAVRVANRSGLLG
jgi:DNA-binding CsgD family transcriptional regulator